MKKVVLGCAVLSLIVPLAACGQTQGKSASGIVAHAAAKKSSAPKHKNQKTTAKKQTKKAASPFEQLPAIYKKIAKAAAHYQPPKQGIDSKMGNLVRYKNGYTFNGKIATSRTYKNGKKPIPTKGQYLGVVMGIWSDFDRNYTLQEVRKTHSVGGTTFDKLPARQKVELVQARWRDSFKSDIANKLTVLTELKKYTGDYPVLNNVIHQTIDLLQKAQKFNPTTKEEMQHAYGYYKKAVKKLTETKKAFNVSTQI